MKTISDILRAKRAAAGGLAIINNIFANGAEEIDVQSLISTQIKDSEIRVEHKTQSVVNQNKIVTKIPIFYPMSNLPTLKEAGRRAQATNVKL